MVDGKSWEKSCTKIKASNQTFRKTIAFFHPPFPSTATTEKLGRNYNALALQTSTQLTPLQCPGARVGVTPFWTVHPCHDVKVGQTEMVMVNAIC